MSWIAPEADRADTLPVGQQRAQLQSFLDHQRTTLLVKCGGLDAAQLRRRPVPGSTLSLLGLVRHLAEVERGWFRCTAGGADIGYLYCSETDRDGDFDHVEDADPQTAFELLRAEWAACDAAVAGIELTTVFDHPRRADRRMDLRWIYLHMIEEYARHLGHADLLRELVDGRTGY